MKVGRREDTSRSQCRFAVAAKEETIDWRGGLIDISPIN